MNKRVADLATDAYPMFLGGHVLHLRVVSLRAKKRKDFYRCCD